MYRRRRVFSAHGGGAFGRSPMPARGARPRRSNRRGARRNRTARRRRRHHRNRPQWHSRLWFQHGRHARCHGQLLGLARGSRRAPCREAVTTMWAKSLRFAALTLFVLVTTATAALAARTYLVGPQRDLKVPSAAAAMVKDGDTVLIDAGEYSDCAVWRANDLTIEGKGNVTIRDKVCEDKAIFVTVGANITIRGLEFAHA